MADYSPYVSPEEYRLRENERMLRMQDSAYDSYKENITFSLEKDLSDLREEIQARFDEAESPTMDETPPEEVVNATESPNLYEYTVTYRVLAYNPMHALAVVNEAQNVEVKLVPYVG